MGEKIAEFTSATPASHENVLTVTDTPVVIKAGGLSGGEEVLINFFRGNGTFEPLRNDDGENITLAAAGKNAVKIEDPGKYYPSIATNPASGLVDLTASSKSNP